MVLCTITCVATKHWREVMKGFHDALEEGIGRQAGRQVGKVGRAVFPTRPLALYWATPRTHRMHVAAARTR